MPGIFCTVENDNFLRHDHPSCRSMLVQRMKKMHGLHFCAILSLLKILCKKNQRHEKAREKRERQADIDSLMRDQ